MTESVNPDLVSMIVSNDGEMIKRIGEWMKDHSKGIDVARLFIALVETDELEPTTKVTAFIKRDENLFP